MNARTDWQAHAGLLEQVAGSEAELRDVRRAFGVVPDAPLAEHELDTHERHKRAAVYPIRYRACANGPCAQGRKLCPTPQACQVSAEPDPPRPPLRRGDGLIAAALVVASWAAVAGVLYVMGVRL